MSISTSLTISISKLLSSPAIKVVKEVYPWSNGTEFEHLGIFVTIISTAQFNDSMDLFESCWEMARETEDFFSRKPPT